MKGGDVHIAIFNGLLKAYASNDNPLQTIVELVITPFGANKNKQGIKKSEASNILRTCVNQPIKINYETGRHKDSYPVGVITEAQETETEIIGLGVLWPEEYPEVAEYLRKRTAENNPVSTSWEILYAGTYIEDDIEWLTGCYYAANTIVENPSYPGKTLMKCIAEDLGIEERVMEDNEKTEAEGLEDEREEINDLQSMVSSLFSLLDNLWYKTFEIEEAEMVKTENIDGAMGRINDLVNRLTTRANDAGVALAETKTTLESLQSELDDVKSKLTVLETEKAEAELQAKNTQRQDTLSSLGYTVAEEDKDRIFNLDDTAFDMFVFGLKAGGSVKKETAENKSIKLPDPVSPQEIDNSVVAESHKAIYTRGTK